MKVHRYQIEVMWSMLIILNFWVEFDNMCELQHQLGVQESLQKRPPSPNQIRPPPL